jgi:Uncharacterised protein family (UPF0158)
VAVGALFIETVRDTGRADRLEIAISGRGAFRRFKDVLERWPGELERWYAFSAERQHGRARARLAGALEATIGLLAAGAGRISGTWPCCRRPGLLHPELVDPRVAVGVDCEVAGPAGEEVGGAGARERGGWRAFRVAPAGPMAVSA